MFSKNTKFVLLAICFTLAIGIIYFNKIKQNFSAQLSKVQLKHKFNEAKLEQIFQEKIQAIELNSGECKLEKKKLYKQLDEFKVIIFVQRYDFFQDFVLISV